MVTKALRESKALHEIHKIRENITKDIKNMSVGESIAYWKTNLKEGLKKEKYKMIATSNSCHFIKKI